LTTKDDSNRFRDKVNQELFDLREYLRTIVLKEDLVSEVSRIEKICIAIQDMKSVKVECEKNKLEFCRLIENLKDDVDSLKKTLKKQGRSVDDFKTYVAATYEMNKEAEKVKEYLKCLPTGK
jgi:SMC interacting uncharacterized protein involved in chromosome segregation